MKVDTQELRGLAKFTRGEAGRYCPAADNLEAAADLIDRLAALPSVIEADVPLEADFESDARYHWPERWRRLRNQVAAEDAAKEPTQ